MLQGLRTDRAAFRLPKEGARGSTHPTRLTAPRNPAPAHAHPRLESTRPHGAAAGARAAPRGTGSAARTRGRADRQQHGQRPQHKGGETLLRWSRQERIPGREKTQRFKITDSNSRWVQTGNSYNRFPPHGISGSICAHRCIGEERSLLKKLWQRNTGVLSLYLHFPSLKKG